MTKIQRLAYLRALLRRVQDEIDDLSAQVARAGQREPRRPTRLQTISPEQRDAVLRILAEHRRKVETAARIQAAWRSKKGAA